MKYSNLVPTATNDVYLVRYKDIEKEASNYRNFLKNKKIYCICEDPELSNIWAFFHKNFSNYKIKEILAIHKDKVGSAYLAKYTGDGNEENVTNFKKKKLKGSGDFKEKELISLLNDKEIVVITNPPSGRCSKEFIPMLIDNNIKFLIVGDINWISYRCVLNSMKNKKIQLGYSFVRSFKTLDGKEKRFGSKIWFTNLPIRKVYQKYFSKETEHVHYKGNEDKYIKYADCDAINVDNISEIPDDYDGLLGCPISFITKMNPDEFEIVDCFEPSLEIDKCLKHIDGFKVLKSRYRKINGIDCQKRFHRLLIKKK